MTNRSLAAVPAALAGLLVLWRVVGSSVGALVADPTDGLVTAGTVVLLVAALAFLAAATWFCLDPAGSARPAFQKAWVTFLVVMAAFLVLGVALGRHVPWTAYAVLVAVAALGVTALVLAGRRAPGAR